MIKEIWTRDDKDPKETARLEALRRQLREEIITAVHGRDGEEIVRDLVNSLTLAKDYTRTVLGSTRWEHVGEKQDKFDDFFFQETGPEEWSPLVIDEDGDPEPLDKARSDSLEFFTNSVLRGITECLDSLGSPEDDARKKNHLVALATVLVESVRLGADSIEDEKERSNFVAQIHKIASDFSNKLKAEPDDLWSVRHH